MDPLDRIDAPAPAGFQSRNRIGPLQAVASNPRDAACHVCTLATTPRNSGSHIHLVNAYTIAIADRDPAFAEVLSGSSINLPDGKPLSWVSRARRDDIPLSQVRGPQFFLDVFDHGRTSQVRHYLLGSTDEVLGKLQTAIDAKFPGAEIVGAFSPPFRELTADEIRLQDQAIVDSGAHIVWVGLGTPKQDYEAKRLAETIPVVAIAVGAAFDFAAGTVREAPALFRSTGFEWLYRLMSEPRRLWRRYVFGNARFLLSVVRRHEHEAT